MAEPGGAPADGEVAASGLAAERTFLAWNRTGLAIMATGGAALRVFPGLGRHGTHAAAGTVMLAAGALVWVAGWLRYRAGRAGHGLPAAPARTVRLMWAAMVAVSLAALTLAGFSG